ncbi:hypothetical protein LINGRAHAP2_LOCUS18760, partial [Linum grandiflorum]
FILHTSYIIQHREALWSKSGRAIFLSKVLKVLLLFLESKNKSGDGFILRRNFVQPKAYKDRNTLFGKWSPRFRHNPRSAFQWTHSVIKIPTVPTEARRSGERDMAEVSFMDSASTRATR